MLQTLRKAGGSLVMTVPKAFVDQNEFLSKLCAKLAVVLQLNTTVAWAVTPMV